MTDLHSQKILILDFGSQYTQLIARRIREIGVFSEIRAWDITEQEIREFDPQGIILSGGPESVTGGASAPRAPDCVFTMGLPILGICYGMQTMAGQLGGKVDTSDIREFGYAQVKLEGESSLLREIADHTDNDGESLLDVWMSHGDKVVAMPEGFSLMASTPSCPIAGMVHEEKRFLVESTNPHMWY